MFFYIAARASKKLSAKEPTTVGKSMCFTCLQLLVVKCHLFAQKSDQASILPTHQKLLKKEFIVSESDF